MLDRERMPPKEVLSALPVFPLPNVVFLPGMVLPLNVFEPRYLDLVDHVLEGGRHIGVPLLVDGPRRRGEKPDIEPVFGVGHLVFHRRLPDGRRLIRLEGLGRVRAVQELPQTKRFREFEVEPLAEDEPLDHRSFGVLVAQLRRLFDGFEPEDREMVESIVGLHDPRVVLYAATALLPSIELARARASEAHPAEGRCPLLDFQQKCLDARDADVRVELLLERAAALLAERDPTVREQASWLN
jgi:Lon protease-like protein